MPKDFSLTESSWAFLMGVFSVAGAALMLYGIYICLFLLSIYIFARRRKTRGVKLLMAWSCVIAAGGTAQIVLTIAQTVGVAQSVAESGTPVSFQTRSLTSTGQNVIAAMSNFATDSLYVEFFLQLESGAIYCIAVMFPLVTGSLNASEAYAIELGFGTQLVNMIPTFTLVYVGLDDTVHKSRLENNPEAPPSRGTTRSAAVQQSQSAGVLDIKPQETRNKNDEYV
ncbi:hypothetical protein MSAN_02103100 [Mycena sanguinolenta]|uniref:Uncharacterized protein n=1 Tax=Mycena sanguinolenta TaxID=230812 RepID=A0A8H6XHS3_9AGAR|nr:hypothetical protein MSAN_02103100 [Mycena sanguinolenta]